MTSRAFTDILPHVRKPSSYVGGEVNSIAKEEAALFFALCFPDSYEIGTAHFGIQILYHLLNKHSQIAAERVFSPGTDMEALLREADQPIVSLETHKPLSDFDIIGFSLLYELNYTNILALMDLAKIPLYASERSASHPLIIGGGPCTVNPEPLANFFDALVVGDGEEAVMAMAAVWLEHKARGRENDKPSILKDWAEIEGVYIPSFFSVNYDDQGFQRLTPIVEGYSSVNKAVVPELKNEDFPATPVVPFGRPVHDRLRLEISRGCSRGCRFCQAGIIYRPVRERSTADLLALTEASLATTGYDDVSFLSLSTGDYCDLNNLLTTFIQRYYNRHIAVSIPSFRAGSLNGQDMAAIKEIRKTGFTIAPEAGSQRLRDVINKNITEADILNTVETAFDLGWNLIKIYFMVGLPTETTEDIEEIVRLVRTLKKLGKKKPEPGKKGLARQTRRINVSVATFIPKPHTPFQWEGQVDLETARKKIFYLKEKLASRQVGFKWQGPEMSLLEGVFARGDRRLSGLIETAYRKGCRFDGWSDKFNFKTWQEAACKSGVDFDFYTTRPRKTEEPLPWEIISAGVSEAFLKTERLRARNGELTADCRQDACNQCGVCDFDRVAPKISKSVDRPPAAMSIESCRPTAASSAVSSSGNDPAIRYAFSYAKTGEARYFGHLEFINLLVRAIHRAQIPVIFSRGFHPKPKISFESSLAVGIESEREAFYLMVERPLDVEKTIADLNKQLPGGIKIHDVRLVAKKKAAPRETETPSLRYRIVLNETQPDFRKIEAFLSADRFLLTVKDKKGNDRQIDLKAVVSHLSLADTNALLLETRGLPGKNVRPREIIRAVFSLNQKQVEAARVIKINNEITNER